MTQPQPTQPSPVGGGTAPTAAVLAHVGDEAGERLGFLPGTLSEKIDPYLRPLYDALHDMVDPDSIPRLITSGTIEVATAGIGEMAPPVGTSKVSVVKELVQSGTHYTLIDSRGIPHRSVPHQLATKASAPHGVMSTFGGQCRRRSNFNRCRRIIQKLSSGPAYSITSSASASSEGATVRPSARAVPRLIANSNLSGCCTGSSAGGVPLRMRSTYDADRRKISVESGP